MKNNCIYYVEGQCEERFLNVLKENPQRIKSGRIKVFNVIQELIPKSQLITIQAGTVVVLVFDTDVPNTEVLKRNIQHLRKFCNRVKIVFLPQVLNFEDELVRCCNIRSVLDLTHSRSTKGFKRDFCAISNLRVALENVNLDITKLWTKEVPQEFSFVERNAYEIKM